MTAEPSPTPHAADPVDLPGELGRYGIVIALIAFFAGYVASGILGSAYASLTGAAIDSYPVSIAGLVGLWIGTLGIPIYASRRWGSGDLARDYGLRIEWRPDVPVGLVAGIGGQFVLVYGIVWIFELFQPHLKLNEAAVEIAQKSRGAQFALFSALVVLVAPVIEELFFRGLFLRALERRMPSWAAVLISGTVFGLAHISGGTVLGAIALGLALAAFGCLLGVLAVRTRRLGASIVAHMAFNAVAVVQIFAQSGRGH